MIIGEYKLYLEHKYLAFPSMNVFFDKIVPICCEVSDKSLVHKLTSLRFLENL